MSINSMQPSRPARVAISCDTSLGPAGRLISMPLGLSRLVADDETLATYGLTVPAGASRTDALEITTTRVLAEELALDRTRLGATRRRKARQLLTGHSGFVVGRSMVGGPDVIGGPAVYSNVDAVAAIVVPAVVWSSIPLITQRDIIHLAIHCTYNWDFFVTLESGILGKAKLLSDALGIRVLTPDAALAAVT